MIEKWVEEPFFNKTLTGAFVKTSLKGRWAVLEIKKVVEDEAREYKLKNGKETCKYLMVLAGEDLPEKWKEVPITQVSNQKI
mmetsp:Transcript_34703/g.53228  ORF Transcript_34703/g.53228 Transcript_34703/m.53228 type:complete len:82 (+) Transcript_34703:771-1016(+)